MCENEGEFHFFFFLFSFLLIIRFYFLLYLGNSMYENDISVLNTIRRISLFFFFLCLGLSCSICKTMLFSCSFSFFFMENEKTD